MKKRTDELFKILEKKNNINDYFKENEQELTEKSLPELLCEMLCRSGKEKADVISKSNIDKTYGYQMFSGVRTNPSRDKILMLCFGLDADMNDVQTLLKKAGYAPLYPRIRRDSALIFAFEQKLTLIETNELLYDINEEILE